MEHSFPTSYNNVGNYLNSKGFDEDMPKIGSSTQRDETEDVGILETSEATVEDIPLPIALTETSAPKVIPAAEAAMIKYVSTAEPVSIETPQGEVAELEVNIATSASAGKNHSVLNLARDSLYLSLNPKKLAKVPKLLLQRCQSSSKRRK